MILVFGLTTPTASAAFSDVPSNAWYYGDVNDVQKYGLFNGVGDNRFDPQGKLTLAQAITLAARTHAVLNKRTISNTGNPWYQPYLNYAIQNGIYATSEYGTNYNVGCSRMAMAVLFQRVFPKSTEQNLNTVTSLPDVQNSGSGAAVFYLYRQGILTGNDEYGTFKPDSGISRAETAAILNRVMDTSKRKKFVLKAAPESLPELKSLLGKSKSQVIDILGTDYKRYYRDDAYAYVNELYYASKKLSVSFYDDGYGGEESSHVEYSGTGPVYGKFHGGMTLQQLRSLTGNDGYFGEDAYWDLSANTTRDGYAFAYYLGNGYGIKYFWKADSTGRSPSDFVWLFIAQ